MVERSLCMREARGSIPRISKTIIFYFAKQYSFLFPLISIFHSIAVADFVKQNLWPEPVPNLQSAIQSSHLIRGSNTKWSGDDKWWALVALTYVPIHSFVLREGKVETFKESIEAIDAQNKSITFKFFDGEIDKNYKLFKLHLQAIDKGNGGAVPKWSIEYVKLNKDIAPPYHFLDL
ncbi:MLP-like protein 31, partial [Mucuna pruriens]